MTIRDSTARGYGSAASRGFAAVGMLLDAIGSGESVLVVRATCQASAAALTRERILRGLAGARLVPAGVWQMAADAWLVTLESDADDDGPIAAIQARTAVRAFRDHLNAGDPATPASPAFTVMPIQALPFPAEAHEHMAELEALLDIVVSRRLECQFQPIVNLADGRVTGYEALMRGPKGAVLRRAGSLFRAAERADIVAWYDLACQEQVFARAREIGMRNLLFVNMDADGLASHELRGQSPAAHAREHRIAPSSIVIEITERQAVPDFPRLARFIERLRDEGFRIAVDDAGAGYSSLETIAEIRPDFVKVGRSLVRNIDVNGERRELLGMLINYAERVGSRVLAEGVETAEELATLIDLGAPFAQGYYMGKPEAVLRGTPRAIRDDIRARHEQRARRSGGSVSVGSIARPATCLSPNAPLSAAIRLFAKHDSLTSIIVIDDAALEISTDTDTRTETGAADGTRRPRGVLMRRQITHILDLAREARAASVTAKQSVDQWMRTSVLSVAAGTPVHEAVRQLLTRSDLDLETDVIVTETDGGIAGVLPVRALLTPALAVIPVQHQGSGRRAA